MQHAAKQHPEANTVKCHHLAQHHKPAAEQAHQQVPNQHLQPGHLESAADILQPASPPTAASVRFIITSAAVNQELVPERHALICHTALQSHRHRCSHSSRQALPPSTAVQIENHPTIASTHPRRGGVVSIKQLARPEPPPPKRASCHLMPPGAYGQR